MSLTPISLLRGQQDLLRIFEAFAHPDGGARPIQVVYVTHSPFLIDKNHAERVRVLEKGEHDEGTRVVANASRNHYEPLRSAFGSFVGETTFMGTCNLVLECPSDQIIIAGLASWLISRGTPTSQRLDLNTLTLVPADGASHVPYIAYLARGRDVDRPAVIVLLDGDRDGDLAKAGLRRGGPRGKELVPSSLVLQLTDLRPDRVHVDNPQGCRTIEDLVPFELVVKASRRYCQEFVPEVDADSFAPTTFDAFASDVDTHEAVQAALRAHVGNPDLELNKIGLARFIVAVIREASNDESTLTLANQTFASSSSNSVNVSVARNACKEASGSVAVSTALSESFTRTIPQARDERTSRFLLKKLRISWTRTRRSRLTRCVLLYGRGFVTLVWTTNWTSRSMTGSALGGRLMDSPMQAHRLSKIRR
jgi:hypothetical protein